MPAKAGIQNYLKTLDSRLRGNDVKGRFKTYYKTITLEDEKKIYFTVLIHPRRHNAYFLFYRPQPRI